MKNLNPEAQLKGILDLAERIRKTPGAYGGQRHEKEFLAYMGLPENLADYPGRIGELVAKIRGELGHMTEGQIAAGNESAEAWQGLQTRLAALSDTIGSKFVPMLSNAYDSMSKLEGSATAWASAIKIDPSVTAAWDDVSKRIGADVKSIVAGLSSFDDLASRPRVLPLSVAPEWRGFAEDIKNLAGDAGNVVKLVDGLNQAKINWAEIFNLAGMTDQVEKIRAAGAAFEAMLEEWLPGYKQLQQTKNAPKEAAPIPGVGHLLDKPTSAEPLHGRPDRPVTPTPANGPDQAIRAWWNSRTSPPTAPATPPAPLGRPVPPHTLTPTPLPPFVFKKSDAPIDAPRVPKSMISPISYNPEGNPFRRPENPLQGQAPGASPNTADAINIIYQGTRRGVLDGMLDLIRQLRADKKANPSGVQSASYETGGGAGGPDGGGEGTGGGRGGSGAGGLPDASPAGRIGREVRRHLHGHGGGSYVPHGIQPEGGAGTPKGNEAALAKQGYDYWRSQGLTHEQALSVLGNERGENPLGALAVGDRGSFGGHGTVGQFQWDPPRRAQILAGTGIDVATANFMDQQKAARWEMEHSPDAANRVWERLKAAKTREEQIGLLVHNYERSLNQPRDIAKRMGHAARYAKLHLDKATVAGGPGRSPSGPSADRLGHDSPTHSSLWGKSDPINPTFGPAWEAGKFREGIFGRNGFSGPHNSPVHVERPPLPAGQQDVSLPPLHRGDLARLERRNRPEPGSLLRAADQRQAAASAKHEVTGSASLHVKLAAGLAPASGVKTKGGLFKEVRLDRAPLPLASTMG